MRKVSRCNGHKLNGTKCNCGCCCYCRGCSAGNKADVKSSSGSRGLSDNRTMHSRGNIYQIKLLVQGNSCTYLAVTFDPGWLAAEPTMLVYCLFLCYPASLATVTVSACCEDYDSCCSVLLGSLCVWPGTGAALASAVYVFLESAHVC